MLFFFFFFRKTHKKALNSQRREVSGYLPPQEGYIEKITSLVYFNQNTKTTILSLHYDNALISIYPFS